MVVVVVFLEPQDPLPRAASSGNRVRSVESEPPHHESLCYNLLAG